MARIGCRGENAVGRSFKDRRGNATGVGFVVGSEWERDERLGDRLRRLYPELRRDRPSSKRIG